MEEKYCHPPSRVCHHFTGEEITLLGGDKYLLVEFGDTYKAFDKRFYRQAKNLTRPSKHDSLIALSSLVKNGKRWFIEGES